MRREKWLFVAVGLAAALAAVPVRAEDREGILVWGVSAVSDIDETGTDSIASSLTREIRMAVSQPVLDEDTVDEAVADARDNGFCDEDNLQCVVQVGREANASEAVTGDVGVVGNVWILTLRRINVPAGVVVKQVSAQSRGDIDPILYAMSDLVAQLFDIPHNGVGVVRKSHHGMGTSYLIITYGPAFAWVEPVTWVGSYPWWWAGHVHYYHRHHVWHHWHRRYQDGYHPARPRPGHVHGTYHGTGRRGHDRPEDRRPEDRRPDDRRHGYDRDHDGRPDGRHDNYGDRNGRGVHGRDDNDRRDDGYNDVDRPGERDGERRDRNDDTWRSNPDERRFGPSGAARNQPDRSKNDLSDPDRKASEKPAERRDDLRQGRDEPDAAERGINRRNPERRATDDDEIRIPAAGMNNGAGDDRNRDRNETMRQDSTRRSVPENVRRDEPDRSRTVRPAHDEGRSRGSVGGRAGSSRPSDSLNRGESVGQPGSKKPAINQPRQPVQDRRSIDRPRPDGGSRNRVPAPSSGSNNSNSKKKDKKKDRPF